MAISIRNIQTASATGLSLTITKPTGLEVSDIMVACIVSGNANATPAGWTARTSDTTYQTIFTKTATSDDVSASNFTFTSTGNPMIGALYALSGATLESPGAVQDGVITKHGGSGPVSASTACDITPLAEGAFLLHFGACFDADNDRLTWDNRSITGGTNPTWTERYESYVHNGARTVSMSVADAVYAETVTITAINASATLVYGEQVDAEPHAFLVLNPQADATGTNALLEVSPLHLAQNGVAGTTGTNELLEVEQDEIFEQSGKGTAPTPWAGDSKPTANWDNDTL